MSKRKPHNKLTQEQVILQFIEVHGEAFDYGKVVYVDTHTPVEVYCKKHDFTFFPTPKNHKKGAKCTHCGRESQIEKAKKPKEKFIEDAIRLYNDKDDFTLVDYSNNKNEVTLVCKHHGEFKVRPDQYLRGRGCKECVKKKTKSNNKELFIQEAIKIYGDKDDYTDTKILSSQEKIKVRCTKHNHIFKKDIQTYLAGYGCPKCSAENYSKLRTKTTEDFIKEAEEIHGNTCDYSETIYKGCRQKIRAKCNIHNEYFETHPINHLRGGRCRKCLSERLSEAMSGKEGVGGYSRSGYINQANGRIAYVYLIRCYNENEEFYKIGKTFLNINSRFTKSNLPYIFEEVNLHYGEAGYIFDLEIELHRKYKSYRHSPDKWFAGHTECYNLELPIQEIIDLECQIE